MTVLRGAAVARPGLSARYAYADNLKVVLVVGVIVAHATMAWTGAGTWVFDEPRVREPLLTIGIVLEAIGALFGMALFFFIAGVFTPRSLARKGPCRFLADRFVRLGIPMAFYVLALSPFVEYADPDNAGWERGFAPFAVHVWWPPVPGPTWFLGILLLFTVVYTVVRTVLPRRTTSATPLRWWHLVTAGAVVALGSYFVRISVPLGEERWHLALGQVPAWVVGFALGVLAAEHAWLEPLEPLTARRIRDVARAALAGCVVVMGLASAMGADIDQFGGGGTWQSLMIAVLEGALVVAMSFWLPDLFRRRFDRQSRLVREMSRAAFAAFVVHQVVLVGLVLASRYLSWPPEVDYAAVGLLGVLISFAIGALLVRLPGVSRVV